MLIHPCHLGCMHGIFWDLRLLPVGWYWLNNNVALCPFVNLRRACAAWVTVVVLCECLSAHAILAVRVVKSIMKYTIVLSILKRHFLFKIFIRKLECFYLLRQRRPSLVHAYSACNVSYTSFTCLLTHKHCV